MDNSVFVDEEDIPMVHEDDDYDDYNTLNASRIDEASFTVSATTKATSTLRLMQKIKRDKLTALYRHLNVTGNLDLIDFNQFKLTADHKKGATIFEFYNGSRWVPLTKQTGEFFAPKTLRDTFGEINAMKIFLGIDTTPPSLERSISAASKLKSASYQQIYKWKAYPWKSFRPCLKIFMLRHEKHRKIPTLICENF